jgi:hypothetical protein
MPQLRAATPAHPGLLANTLVSTNAITNQVVPPYNPAPAPGTSEAEIQFQATNQPSLSRARSANVVVGARVEAATPQARKVGQIELLASGAVARYGPHKVNFAANLHTTGAVDLTMMDGQRLRSHILGLCYYTPTGQSILIAELKDTIGELVSTNQVLYRNAFDDVTADVLYTYTETSLEQDVVIRRRLPSPSRFGLIPAQVRLAVLSEFVNPSVPLRVPCPVDLSARNQAAGVQGESSLPDELIIFNTMRMGPGKAFTLGDSSVEVPVGKSWTKLNFRDFLVESTPYPLIRAQLDALPDSAQITPRKTKSFRTALLDIPRPPAASGQHSAFRTPHSAMKLAQARPQEPGVVLDYLISSSALLNVQFGPSASNKVGFAAVGQTTNDYWNWYLNPNTNLITVTNLLWSNTNGSGVSLTVSNAPGQWYNPVSDAMFQTYIYHAGGSASLTLSNLAAGTYDFYLYGHAGADDVNGDYQLTSGTNDYGAAATTTVGSGSWNSTVWQEGVHYVVFRAVAVLTNTPVQVNLQKEAAGYGLINGLQIMASIPQTNVASLVNVNFGAGGEVETGPAAVGQTPNDYWNNLVSTNVTAKVSAANLLWSDGFTSGFSVNITNAPGINSNLVSDVMYSSYVFCSNQASMVITVSNLATGTYDFYLYGHGNSNTANGVFGLATGTNDFGTRATTLSGSNSWTSTQWQEGQQYMTFRNIPVLTNQPVLITVKTNGPGFALINGLQIVLPSPGPDTDSDGDGIPDWWEIQNGKNPHAAGDQPIAINLTSPANNGSYAEPANIQVVAAVAVWNTTVTNVAFFAGSTRLTGMPGAPYTYPWPIVPAGTYSLTAVAYGASGITATSAPVSVSITNLCTP